MGKPLLKAHSEIESVYNSMGKYPNLTSKIHGEVIVEIL